MSYRSARLLLVAVLGCTVSLIGVPAGAATAAGPTPAAGYEIGTGTYPTTSGGSSVFGSPDATGPQYQVSTAATEFDIRFPGRTSDTECGAVAADGTVVAQDQWYGSNGDDEYGRQLYFPAGSIVAGVRYTVSCRDGAYASYRLTWNVIGTADLTDTVATLNPDDVYLVARAVDSSFFDTKGSTVATLSPGELVRVVGVPGTWTPPGASSTVTVTISPTVGSGSGQTVDVNTPIVSSDGSVVSFVWPTGLPADFATRAFVRVGASATGPVDLPTGTVPLTTTNNWSGFVDTAAKPGSRVSVALSASTVAFTKPKATVRVVVDGGVVPVGAVVIYVDGYVVARSSMATAQAGTVVVPMPKISKGTHSVVAVFQASPVALGAVSAPKPLKVLR